jgi:hypothetical protein
MDEVQQETPEELFFRHRLTHAQRHCLNEGKG